MREMTSYPHPVLGNGDDFTAGRFALRDNTVRYSVDTQDIRIQGTFELEHETLQAMLAAGEAALVIRLDCPKTSFRRVHETTDPSFEIVLPAESVRSRIELEALLVARRDLPGYRPRDVNSLYGQDPAFFVQDGDLLAFAGAVNLPVNLKFDPLTSPLGSIIRLQAVPDRSEVGLDLTPQGDQSEYFVILVPQDMWDIVSNFRATPAIVANLVLPSMVEVLHLMRQATAEAGSDIRGTDWYGSMTALLRQRQLDLDGDLLETAQKLLSPERGGQRLNPITQAFATLT